MATITIPNQVRQGTVISPSVSWPANLTTASIQFTMPVQADRDNSANTMEIRLEVSTDGGTNWKPYLMAGWRGGSGIVRGGVTNPPPFVALSGVTANAWFG